MKKKLVFLTGAGMSVESGFKTFRGQDGLWEDFPVEQVASHEGWETDPTLVNNFYNNLRRKLYAAQPNEGHRIIASLEDRYDVTVVTQNVDNLHEKAGSTRVIHLHGELTKVCSSRDQFDERYIKELTEENADVQPGEKAGDGSLLRPFIVFFGESVPMISVAASYAEAADVFIIVGTSLNVYPAAGLVRYAKPGTPIYLVDPDDVRTDRIPNLTHLKMGASEGMKALQDLIDSNHCRL
ncbi:MAG: NAD-dependent protein deacylase [Prevotella sp.]|nr:NAD-dependent protein deacylase [Prevotella sp.]